MKQVGSLLNWQLKVYKKGTRSVSCKYIDKLCAESMWNKKDPIQFLMMLLKMHSALHPLFSKTQQHNIGLDELRCVFIILMWSQLLPRSY